MSMGLGKRYFVHIIENFFGNIEGCIEFMNKHKPEDNKHWFELRPIVSVKKGEDTVIVEYQCSLVEETK